MTTVQYKYIVIGGGIAGVTCAETLSTLDSECSILLLSASPLIKAVTHFRKVTKRLEEFDIEERPLFALNTQCPNVNVSHEYVNKLHTHTKVVETDKGKYTYEKLCICSGATPKLIAENNPYVLGIRDTETVKVFQERLKNAKTILIVGNGGIATELVYEIEGCRVIWAIKDSNISQTFIDAGASQFFMPIVNKSKQPEAATLKRTKYKVQEKEVAEGSGSALGPDWHSGLDMHGSIPTSHNISIEFNVEVTNIMSHETYIKQCGKPTEGEWPVYVELSNGHIHGCDLVISATGVIPNIKPFTDNTNLTVSSEGGLCVDEYMHCSVPDVYAAGDVCSATWTWAPLWQQMRLWTQARQMGAYAAQCMHAHVTGEPIYQDFCFEMFAHVTKFFNYKVVLLGKFNAQGLDPSEYNLLVRVTRDKEYVKAVMKDGRMLGAVLIGDTDLEETFENLILNQMDLSQFGEDLLDPNIDIDDFFD